MSIPSERVRALSAVRGVRRYCSGREARLEARWGALLAAEEARLGCGQEAQRVSALRQFLVGPVLHQVLFPKP